MNLSIKMESFVKEIEKGHLFLKEEVISSLKKDGWSVKETGSAGSKGEFFFRTWNNFPMFYWNRSFSKEGVKFNLTFNFYENKLPEYFYKKYSRNFFIPYPEEVVSLPIPVWVYSDSESDSYSEVGSDYVFRSEVNELRERFIEDLNKY